MRKWWRLLVVLVALVGLAGVGVLLWPAPERPGVSLTTIARLVPGMSEADVAAALGPPTADLTDHPPVGVPPPTAGGKLLKYAGDRATATVEFDPDGWLVRCHPVVHVVTGLERIRLRLNWW